MSNLRDAQSARSVLRKIGNHRHSNATSARDRVLDMMAGLDFVILHLPDDPPDDVMAEIERIVTTLRTSDEAFVSGNTRTGMQSLELARARLDRLTKQLSPPTD